LKSIETVRYSVPVGTSKRDANCFNRIVALDRSMVISSGGSELVPSPFKSSSSRIDWGMAFSRNPSSVNRKTAIASPVSSTVISSEFAVKAEAGQKRRTAIPAMRTRRVRVREAKPIIVKISVLPACGTRI